MTAIYADARTHKRTMKKAASTSRKRCSCGCGRRATHIGLANNLGMLGGCELTIRRWVRDGSR